VRRYLGRMQRISVAHDGIAFQNETNECATPRQMNSATSAERLVPFRSQDMSKLGISVCARRVAFTLVKVTFGTCVNDCLDNDFGKE
jgi:hypothetical protein